ncbi:YodL domain-containing protein [uncultured Flavonifractor sp.]|uniref:YodL domain-containing protein n=1 Tax=uncultured Flavonifractor sp. TaxID=1193534 RepID=UPI002594B024|nr:YodL domain-containing protein [uncultured Flavonifractor sp.]
MRELSIISARRLGCGDGGYIGLVRCFFKLLGLRAGHNWSTSDYMAWVTIQQNVFYAGLREKKEKPGDFWTAFGQWLEKQVSGDSYILYKPGSSQYQAPLDTLRKWGLAPDDRNYVIAWSAPLAAGLDAAAVAEEFASNKPCVYDGEGPCVGDVIVLSQAGKRTAWFRDADGFVKLNGFEKVRWLKEA